MILTPIYKSKYFSADGETLSATTLAKESGSIASVPSLTEETVLERPTTTTLAADPEVMDMPVATTDDITMSTRPQVINVSIDNVPSLPGPTPPGRETKVVGSVPPLLGGGFGGGGGGSLEEEAAPQKKKKTWLWLLLLAGGGYAYYKMK